MNKTDFLSSLNLGTLIIVLVIILAVLAIFLRKRSHRHPMEGRQERNIAQDLDANRAAPDQSPRE